MRISRHLSAETENVLLPFKTLARIHDEATESGDSSDFGIHYHVDAGADERSYNSCEDNKYETCTESAG